jgi:hypothetical protein
MAARLVCCLHIVDILASAGKEAEILLSLRTGCPTACRLIATSSALSNKTTSTSGDRRPHGQRQNRDRSHPRDHGRSHPRHHGRSHPGNHARSHRQNRGRSRGQGHGENDGIFARRRSTARGRRTKAHLPNRERSRERGSRPGISSHRGRARRPAVADQALPIKTTMVVLTDFRHLRRASGADGPGVVAICQTLTVDQTDRIIRSPRRPARGRRAAP